MFTLETDRDRYHFFETDTDIFKNIFIDIWSVSNIRLATDADIPQFTYRYICRCRYFNKSILVKLVWIAYSSDLHQP